MRIKKALVLMLAVVVGCGGLMGCKRQPENKVVDKTVYVSEETSSTDTETSSEVVPEIQFSDHETLEEAVAESEINLVLPEKVDGYEPTLYSNVGKDYIEVMYTATAASEDGTTNMMILRKQPSEAFADISGDETAYPLETVSEVEGVNVTMRSMEGNAFVAMWYEDGASYALISRYGMDAQMMTQLVTEIITIN